MDSDGSPGTGPETGTTTGEASTNEEAAETSPRSSEGPAPRETKSQDDSHIGTGRSSSQDDCHTSTGRSSSQDDCHTGIGSLRRVLRDRTVRATVPRERAEGCSRSKNDGRRKRPGRPTGTRSRDTGTTRKKPKQASPRAPQPKRQRRPVPPRSTPEKVCKTEPETEVASRGVEEDTSKGDDQNTDGDVAPADDPSDPSYTPEAKKQKERRRPSIQKESERTSEEDTVKIEGWSEIAVKMEEEDDVEQPRKRGRRRKDDQTPQLPKKRKKPPVQYVRCEIEGCGTVLAHPRYLQHHIKYQHLLKKKYVCQHPSCGRLFRLQKQLLRHAKHHTDQRDYICEFCARAFKSSHNLAVHRMIHTGEKPIQCEICGFTCRQKASLNWHMKKHDADASYQFACSICGKKFEKKDCVVAHKAKSHPEVLIAEALAADDGTLLTGPVLGTLPGACPPDVRPAGQGNQGGGLAPPHEAPALLHLAASTARHLQLSALAEPDPQVALLTLNSVTALSPSALEPPREEDELLWEQVVVGEQGVGEMVWEGGGGGDHGAVVWEGEGERQILVDGTEVRLV